MNIPTICFIISLQGLNPIFFFIKYYHDLSDFEAYPREHKFQCLFPVANPSLNCEESYFAQFFLIIENKCATSHKEIQICKKITYRSGRKGMITAETEMKNVWFKASAKKLHK